MDRVILVDEHDREIGTAEKLDAHRDGGKLHRAFSVFLFDAAGRMLLQQRAAAKYHFPRLRTNACCSHPRPGEPVLAAACRRVFEELGVEVELRPAFSFLYTAEDAVSGLTEREFDHVLVGEVEGEPAPNPAEVEALHWMLPVEVLHDVRSRPERYTPWFREALPQLAERGFLATGASTPALPPSDPVA